MIENLNLFGEIAEDPHGSLLGSEFMIPPFSVLEARDGWWQERKRKWLTLGIKSEVGRGPVLMKAHTSKDPSFYAKKRAKEKELGRMLSTEEFQRDHYVPTDEGVASGTSIFDPVLCEVAYSWFCPPGGTILDPFAGGSVRGVVASVLGFPYVGVELRGDQVEANREQAKLGREPFATWHQGDSRAIRSIVGPEPFADFVFSCPPYADLEVYSDDPADLSTLGYPEFRAAYREIIAETCALLKDNRFAAFVVGEVRDKRGVYYNFVGDTIAAFIDAGLAYYNEAVLVTSAGSLPIRARKQFLSGRKIGKTHQNVLVFCKGDPKIASAAIAVANDN